MTKRDLTEFTCDSCGKKETTEKCLGFPYHKDWEYLHEVNGKTLECYAPAIAIDTSFVIEKDKHFCCLKCLLAFVELKYKEQKVGTKEYERRQKTGINKVKQK